MADAGSIARFMVELAFKQDEGSAQKFVKTIDQSEQSVSELQQAVNNLGKAVQDLGKVLGGSGIEEGARKFSNNAHKVNQGSETLRKGILTVGATAVTAGTAWVAAITKVATEYEKLYYSARRVGGTVSDLKNAGAAADQAGIGAEALGGALEGLTSQVRASPGIRQMVNNWIGADWDKVKDKVGKGLVPVLDRLTKMPRELAYQWADQLGISRRVLDDWIVNGEDFKKRMAEVAAIHKSAGIDQEKLAEQSKEFWNALRTIGVQIDAIWGKAFQEAYPVIKGTLDLLSQILGVILKFNNAVPGAALVESFLAVAVGARVLLGVVRSLLRGFRGMGPAAAQGAAQATTAMETAAKTGRGFVSKAIGATIALEAGLANAEQNRKDLERDEKGNPVTGAKSAYSTSVASGAAFGGSLGLMAGPAAVVAVPAGAAIGAGIAAGSTALFRNWEGILETFGATVKKQAETLPKVPPGAAPGKTEQSTAPTGHPLDTIAAPKAKFAEGGIVPVNAHAGEIVLPQKLSALLLGVAQSLGSGGKSGDPWGDTEIKTPLGRMLDWLSGAVVPKVRIENVEDFDFEADEAGGEGEGGAGGPGPGGIRPGTRARTGMGGRGGRTGAGAGGGGGGAGGGAGGGGSAGASGGAGAGSRGGGGGASGSAGGGDGGGGGGGADASRKGGDAGAAGPLAGEAIDVFKKRGWSDAAVQAVMAHGLGEGGFGEQWKQSGAINPKTGQREQSFGHWQFNMQGGEGPAYMAWAEKNKLDPKKTGNQALYVAETMERLQQRNPEKYGGFTQQADFGKAFGQFETGFEKSAGGVAGKMAYANRQGTPETARKALEGYNKGTLNAPAHDHDHDHAAGAGTMPASGLVHEEQGAKARTRKLALSGETRDILEYASAKTGLRADVYSGGQHKEGEGPHVGGPRHDHGGAADTGLTDPKTGEKLMMTNPAHHQRIADYVTASVAGGATGIGAAEDYMGGGGIHIGGGTAGTWGKSLRFGTAPKFIEAAYAKGLKERAQAKLEMAEMRRKAGEQAKEAASKIAKTPDEVPPTDKSPIEQFNDKLIEEARAKAQLEKNKAEAAPSAPPKLPEAALTRGLGKPTAEGKGVMPPGGLITPEDYARYLGKEPAKTRSAGRVEEMKEKMEAVKTGGGELKAGGALTKSGADFDRALAPIGASGLSPGAGGDTVTNNSGGNRSMNVNATNNVTINGNLNESPGSLARRFSDNSERFYADLGRNNRSNVS